MTARQPVHIPRPAPVPTTARAWPPYLLDLDDLAHFLGCCRRTAEKLVYTEQAIPSIQHGRSRRVRRPDAEAYADRLYLEQHGGGMVEPLR